MKISRICLLVLMSFLALALTSTYVSARYCSTTYIGGKPVRFCNPDRAGHNFWNKVISSGAMKSPSSFFKAFGIGGINYGKANGVNIKVKTTKTGTSTSNNACAGSYCTPPPKPTPRTCSYISSWSANWSNCSLSSNIAVNGEMQCTQSSSWSPNYSSYSTYGGCSRGNASRPSVQYVTNKVRFLLESPDGQKSNCINIPANNQASCRIVLEIIASTNGGKPVVGLENLQFSQLKDLSQQPANRLSSVYNGINNSALNFSSASISVIQDGSNNFLEVKGILSRSPFETSTGRIGFSFSYGANSSVVQEIKNVYYKFNKIYSGVLEASDNQGDSWNSIPTLGNSYLYRISALKDGVVPTSNFTFGNLQDKVEPFGSSLSVQDVRFISQSGATLTPWVKFSARINTSKEDVQVNTSPGIQVLGVPISYILDGHTVSYFLSDGQDITTQIPLSIVGEDFKKVKILGLSELEGKNTKVSQDVNVSNVSKAKLTGEIQKNIYKTISQMKSGDIVSGIKYVKGDYVLTATEDWSKYETLVVQGGNLEIKSNINTSELKGIIVLKGESNYNVYDIQNSKGNIFIDKDVTFLMGEFLSDGAIVSSNVGTPYTQDSSVRTRDLSKQLVIQGSVFSKNTIGGSILSGGEYILPGGEKTDNFNLSLIYDFNKIRTNNIGWDGLDVNGDGNMHNRGHDNPLVIIYDPRVHTNPPKLFSQ